MARADKRLVLILISFLAILWLQAPRLTDEFRVDEDFRSFYWMNKFQNLDLFPEQFDRYTIVRVFGTNIPVTFTSLGYSLIFYTASFFVTPIFFSKVLVFLLMPPTLWYLYELGRLARDEQAGFLLALGFLFINLASSSSISITNGLQRSFSYPLLIALLYYLHRQKYGAAALSLIASALIYAPIFALGAATWGLLSLDFRWHTGRSFVITRRGIGYLVCALVVGGLILAPLFFPILADPIIDRTLMPVATQEHFTSVLTETGEADRQRTVYGIGGEAQLFTWYPLVGRGGIVDLGEDLVNLLILILLSLLTLFVCGKRALTIPREVWIMTSAGLILFVSTWLTFLIAGSFILYLPSRYTRTTIPLLLLMIVMLNAREAFTQGLRLFQRRNAFLWIIGGLEILIIALLILYPNESAKIGTLNMKWVLALGGLIFGLLGIAQIRQKSPTIKSIPITNSLAGRLLLGLSCLLFLIGWGAYARLFTEVHYLNPPQAERDFLRFLINQPHDIWIAGSPCSLDNVTLLAQRQTLFSCEHPRNDFNGQIIYQAFQAYYSDQPEVITAFCKAFQIDYLVIDPNTYGDDFLAQGPLFYEPYNQDLLPAIRQRAHFVLPNISETQMQFKNDQIFVIPCDVIR